MFQVLGIILLLITPLLAAPQFDDGQHVFPHEATDDAPAAWSEEAKTKHLDLEDPASWSASTEVLDENHAWFRRRRSVEGSKVDAAEEEARDDLAAAESVVFMPAHLRNHKKVAHEECRKGHREFAKTTTSRSDHRRVKARSRCNEYCCYFVVIDA